MEISSGPEAGSGRLVEAALDLAPEAGRTSAVSCQDRCPRPHPGSDLRLRPRTRPFRYGVSGRWRPLPLVGTTPFGPLVWAVACHPLTLER